MGSNSQTLRENNKSLESTTKPLQIWLDGDWLIGHLLVSGNVCIFVAMKQRIYKGSRLFDADTRSKVFRKFIINPNFFPN
jgi:hypothetical protein